METIWEDSNCISRKNDEVLNEIAAEEATCQDFQLSCCRRYNILGIWFQYSNQILLVDPLDLVNSIYQDDTYYILDYFIAKNKEKPEGYYKVTIQKWNHCFSWRIYHTHSQAMYQMQFTYDDYLKKIKDCINTLYNEWGNGNAVAYKKYDVDLEGIKICKMQLDIAGVTPSHYTLMTKLSIKNYLYSCQMTNISKGTPLELEIGRTILGTLIGIVTWKLFDISWKTMLITVKQK